MDWIGPLTKLDIYITETNKESDREKRKRVRIIKRGKEERERKKIKIVRRSYTKQKKEQESLKGGIIEEWIKKESHVFAKRDKVNKRVK